MNTISAYKINWTLKVQVYNQYKNKEEKNNMKADYR